jgi:hypothetical protein
MAVTPRAEQSMAMMALSFLDLRAQYQAALRRLESAERCLLKCRQPQDDDAFLRCASALREEVGVLSNTNRSVRDVLDQVARDVDRMVPESV